MAFPKHLNICLNPKDVRNVTELGEVISPSGFNVDFVELLSKALRFNYTLYSAAFDQKIKGDLMIGNYILKTGVYAWSSYPYDTTSLTFATKKPSYKAESLSCLKPFTLNVWIGLLLSVILISLMYCLIFRGKYHFMSVVFHTSVTFLGIHRDWRPKSLAQKISVLTGSICMMFLTLGYASVLLSSLTIPVREKGITNFEELYEAMQKEQATAVKYGKTSEDVIMAGSEDKKLKFIGNHILKQKEINFTNFLEVIKPNVAVISSRSMLEGIYGGEEYAVSQDSVRRQYYVLYSYRLDFCCMKQINKVINRLWASGLHQKMYNDYKFINKLKIEFNFKNLHSLLDVSERPLTLSGMSGPFYILLIGYLLGVTSLICEICIHHYMRRA